jgi:hypothetical protein
LIAPATLRIPRIVGWGRFPVRLGRTATPAISLFEVGTGVPDAAYIAFNYRQQIFAGDKKVKRGLLCKTP